MMNRWMRTPTLAGALTLAACGGGAELTLLGAAYYNAGRNEQAVEVLRRAVAAGDAPAAAHLHLGLAHEALGQWQEASDAYAAFLGTGEPSRVRDQIEMRLLLVEWNVMRQHLSEMLDRESALASQPAQPRTVAVFPFRIVADDPRYEPLQNALADMVTTDLSIPGTLQLIERAQISALVREMALSLAGYTEASSAARVGRLMRAAHVVQGSIVLLGDEQLRMEMAVVDPVEGERTGEAVDETALAQIFDAEKQLVLEILGVLGVPLTAAEREAIEENRTGSLLALLAYGEGLDAMDRGDFAAASSAFQNSSALDPSFQAAQVRARESTGLQQASETSGAEIAAAAESELPSAPVQESSVALLDQMVSTINPSGVDESMDPSATEETRENPNSGGVEPAIVVPIDIPNPNN